MDNAKYIEYGSKICEAEPKANIMLDHAPVILTIKTSLKANEEAEDGGASAAASHCHNRC